MLKGRVPGRPNIHPSLLMISMQISYGPGKLQKPIRRGPICPLLIRRLTLCRQRHKKENKSIIYRPLSENSIRLIYLEPYDSSTAGSQMIQCSLKQIPFEQIHSRTGPDYEALSYTWGAPTKLQEIRVGKTSMGIQPNLWCALDKLRREKTKIRILWADAICINQHDDDERSSQVSMMEFIYKRAQKVHVWLGEYPRHVPGGPDIHGSRSNHRVRRETLLWKTVEHGIPDQEDLEWITANPYWERLWIIQEVCCAAELDVVYAKRTTGGGRTKTTVWRWPWGIFINIFDNSDDISTPLTKDPPVLWPH
jgi:hypothetical protein